MTLDHMQKVMCVFFRGTLVPTPTITYINIFPVTSIPACDTNLFDTSVVRADVVVNRALNCHYYGKVG